MSDPVIREIECPRCFQTCGWCGDYRHMHGKLKLPGAPKRYQYCTVKGMEPEGDACAMCHGSQRVTATTHYAPALETETRRAVTRSGAVHEGSDPKDNAQPIDITEASWRL